MPLDQHVGWKHLSLLPNQNENPRSQRLWASEIQEPVQ